MSQSENIEGNKWGLGRIDVKASMPFIKAKLEAGYSVSFVYRELKRKSAINISRYQFSLHVKRFIMETLGTSPSSFNRKLSDQSSELELDKGEVLVSAESRKRSTSATATQKAERTFKHNPLPEDSLLEELGLSKNAGGQR